MEPGHLALASRPLRAGGAAEPRRRRAARVLLEVAAAPSGRAHCPARRARSLPPAGQPHAPAKRLLYQPRPTRPLGSRPAAAHAGHPRLAPGPRAHTKLGRPVRLASAGCCRSAAGKEGRGGGGAGSVGAAPRAVGAARPARPAHAPCPGRRCGAAAARVPRPSGRVGARWPGWEGRGAPSSR